MESPLTAIQNVDLNTAPFDQDSTRTHPSTQRQGSDSDTVPTQGFDPPTPQRQGNDSVIIPTQRSRPQRERSLPTRFKDFEMKR